MQTLNESYSVSLKKRKALRFVFNACLRNEVGSTPFCRSILPPRGDYCLDLVVTNISQIDSCQGGANKLSRECYTVGRSRNILFREMRREVAPGDVSSGV